MNNESPWSPQYLYFSLVSTENNVFDIQVTTLERISKPRSPRTLYTPTALLPALSLASKCSKLRRDLKYTGPGCYQRNTVEINRLLLLNLRYSCPAQCFKAVKAPGYCPDFLKAENRGTERHTALSQTETGFSGVNSATLAQAGFP